MPKALLKRLVSKRAAGPSVVYFTAHKAASIYLKGVIEALADARGLTCVDYADKSWKTGDGSIKRLDQLDYDPVGHAYGPLRMFVDIPKLEEFRVLLHLRDPRDALVSRFFSVAYSHEIGTETMATQRQTWADHDEPDAIDRFVLEFAPSVDEIYRTYIDRLLGLDGVLLTRYERMVTDFPAWLEQVAEHLDLRHERTMRKLIARHIESKPENKNEHVRQITPGDHRRKLKPQTIDKLNNQLADVLNALGYARAKA